MKSSPMSQRRPKASLSASRGSTTLQLRWLVDQQQKIEISRRLRELRDNSPETNRSIADAVGVAERTVAGWASPTNPQSMSYTSAVKVAKLFDVSIDWFWRGREEEQPHELLDRIGELEDRVLGLESKGTLSAPPAGEGDPEKAVEKLAEAKRLREQGEEDDATGSAGAGD